MPIDIGQRYQQMQQLDLPRGYVPKTVQTTPTNNYTAPQPLNLPSKPATPQPVQYSPPTTQQTPTVFEPQLQKAPQPTRAPLPFAEPPVKGTFNAAPKPVNYSPTGVANIAPKSAAIPQVPNTSVDLSGTPNPVRNPITGKVAPLYKPPSLEILPEESFAPKTTVDPGGAAVRQPSNPGPLLKRVPILGPLLSGVELAAEAYKRSRELDKNNQPRKAGDNLPRPGDVSKPDWQKALDKPVVTPEQIQAAKDKIKEAWKKLFPPQGSNRPGSATPIPEPNVSAPFGTLGVIYRVSWTLDLDGSPFTNGTIQLPGPWTYTRIEGRNNGQIYLTGSDGINRSIAQGGITNANGTPYAVSKLTNVVRVDGQPLPITPDLNPFPTTQDFLPSGFPSPKPLNAPAPTPTGSPTPSPSAPTPNPALNPPPVPNPKGLNPQSPNPAPAPNGTPGQSPSPASPGLPAPAINPSQLPSTTLYPNGLPKSPTAPKANITPKGNAAPSPSTPANPYTNPLPEPMANCADPCIVAFKEAQKKQVGYINDLKKTLEEIKKHLGVGELPANLPLLTGDGTEQINNMCDLGLYQVKNLDAIGGAYPLEIKVKKPDGKEVKIKLENQSHATEEMFAALLSVAEDADAAVNIAARLAVEQVSTRIAVQQGNALITAIQKWLNFDVKPKPEKIKIGFSPAAAGSDNVLQNDEMANFLKPSEQNFVTTELSDKTSFKTIIERILNSTEIARAALFHPVKINKDGSDNITGSAILESKQRATKSEQVSWERLLKILKDKGFDVNESNPPKPPKGSDKK